MTTKERQRRRDLLSAQDRIFWRLETVTSVYPWITLVVILDGKVDWERLIAWHAEAAELLPRLKSRVTHRRPAFLAPYWREDPLFDPSQHLRHIALPGPGTERELLDTVEKIGQTPLVDHRPPWEAYVIEGLENGRSAYLLKVSHSIADGLRLRRLLAREMTTVHPHAGGGGPMKQHDGRKRRQWDAASAARRARAVLSFVTQFAQDAADRPKLPKGTSDGIKRHYVTMQVPLEKLKAAAGSVGGTVQDGLMAAIAEGFHRYNVAHGTHRPTMRVLCPFGRPPESQADDPAPSGNHWFLVRFRLPGIVSDPLERIKAIRSAVRTVYRRDAFDWMRFLSRCGALVPSSVLDRGFRDFCASHDFVLTYIPGPNRPADIAGVPAVRAYGIAPTNGNVMTATTVSYGGTCYVMMNIDPAQVDDPELLGRYCQEGMQQILAATPSGSSEHQRQSADASRVTTVKAAPRK
ncbi:wax ester/triacylglycerol synthase domain-containing protein [Allorhizocola rhizosphaerae]|uniref:wax ester/triacylglycerol synthase domain-containing protein n=1 Tax=Allorhizocola rhizosphaerae TaxID=1872709 RepID=UPI000E3E0B8E|nr:wax ester/triacylglycerol synthase domain-containing protein [Allorhizocola rhizosphaerae]